MLKKNKNLDKEGKVKDMIGIIKEIDKLGRIVIPKEYRTRFGLQQDVEIIATEHGILLRNPQYKLVRTDENEKNEDK